MGQIQDALIALAGALFGAIIAFIGTALTLKFNGKKLYAETVSKNRMDWINIWRENISKFLACAEALNDCKNDTCEKGCDCRKEFYESRSMIISRLNMSEDKHILMYKALNHIDCTKYDKDFAKKREYILLLAREILKPEWERVKSEARGKNNIKRRCFIMNDNKKGKFKCCHIFCGIGAFLITVGVLLGFGILFAQYCGSENLGKVFLIVMSVLLAAIIICLTIIVCRSIGYCSKQNDQEKNEELATLYKKVFKDENEAESNSPVSYSNKEETGAEDVNGNGDSSTPTNTAPNAS